MRFSLEKLIRRYCLRSCHEGFAFLWHGIISAVRFDISRRIIVNAWNLKIKFANPRESLRTCLSVDCCASMTVTLFIGSTWNDILFREKERINLLPDPSTRIIRFDGKFVQWHTKFEVRRDSIVDRVWHNDSESMFVHACTHVRWDEHCVRGAYSSMIARWSATISTLPFVRERKYKNIEPDLFQCPIYWERRFHYLLPISIPIESRTISSLIEWS